MTVYKKKNEYPSNKCLKNVQTSMNKEIISVVLRLLQWYYPKFPLKS